MTIRKWHSALIVTMLLTLLGCSPSEPARRNVLIVLTTTTTQDSGILRHLTEAFARKSGLTVKTIVAGSGDVLKQGARGEGDVLLTHSPKAEREWMAQGNGLSRRLAVFRRSMPVAWGACGDRGARSRGHDHRSRMSGSDNVFSQIPGLPNASLLPFRAAS